MGKGTTILVLALAGVLLLSGAALAGGCPYCTDGCDFCCPEFGTGNFVEGTVYTNDLDDGEEPPLYTWGAYPEEWSTSGRWHYTCDYLSRNRFELRWQDVNDELGRGWTRVAVFPLTLEADAWYYDGYAWDHYQPEPALQFQERAYRDLRLRFHDGELDNMLLRYQGADYMRDPGARLQDFDYQRLQYQYNFDLAGGRLHGQVRQTATASNRPRLGPGDYLMDTSLLKLDAELSDRWSAYGRGSFTSFDYEDLPDPEFSSHNYTLGLRYRPDAEWGFDLSYGAKDMPADNIISSHVDESENYGLSVSYAPCGGSWYEAGYRHTSLDFSQLHMQDETLKPLLREGAALTPGDITQYVTGWTPEIDEYYAAGTHRFSDKLSATGRLSYTESDMPGSDLVESASPNILPDERLTGLGTLTYDFDSRNQFNLSGYNQEWRNNARDGNFSLQYVEGSWTRCVSDTGFLTLGVRDTTIDLATTFVVDDYSTDDTSYLVNYTQELADFNYALDFTFTDGRGAEEYEQKSAGLDLKLKSFGPVGLRVDWFDRDYPAWPQFDSEALEFGVSYTLEF